MCIRDRFGMSWAALLALAVCGILLSIALIDAETQTIPDRLNFALAVCGVAGTALSPAGWRGHIIGAVCVSVPMFLLCLAIDGAFGGGDIKLMAAAGLFLGWQNTLLAMFFGILGGGVYGMYLLAAKKADKKDHFAFGPFLCVRALDQIHNDVAYNDYPVRLIGTHAGPGAFGLAFFDNGLVID